MSVKIFLSCVSGEFRAYREFLRSDLTRHNVEVKVQEDFKDLGRGILDALDTYIAQCDAVVHLVGDMTGLAPVARDVQAILAKHPSLASDLPPIGNGEGITYTQWEAWFALYHHKTLIITQAEAGAARGPSFAAPDESRAAQAAHLDRLKQVDRWSAFQFTNADSLANRLKSTAILDLLVSADTEALRETVERLTAELSMSSGQREELVGELQKVEAELRGTVGLVSGFLETMVGRNVAPEHFAATLSKIAGDWKTAGEKIGALTFSSNLSPRLGPLRDEAKAAHETGGLDEAERLLAMIAQEEIEALARLEDHQREVQEEIGLRKKGVAETKAAQAAVAHARLNYREAAQLYAEAADLVMAFDAESRKTWILAQARELYDQGNEFGDNTALADAIGLYRQSLGLAPRKQAPLDGATIQNYLGIALQTLGERESCTVRLEEAVAAFRAALEEWTRDRAPLQWAMTQNNLGNALLRLGERGTAQLEEALKAYRAALKEFAPDRMPLDWAMTQNNLGNALSRLGERRRERERGTALIEEAVLTYRASLEVRTRNRVPLDWAMTQNNLGNALRTLGEREGDTVRLAEAVEAYRAALKEYSRDRVPLDWAMCTGNQGVALMLLAERYSDWKAAKQALEKIEIAYATLREGNHAQFADTFKGHLPKSRALVELLTKSAGKKPTENR